MAKFEWDIICGKSSALWEKVLLLTKSLSFGFTIALIYESVHLSAEISNSFRLATLVLCSCEVGFILLSCILPKSVSILPFAVQQNLTAKIHMSELLWLATKSSLVFILLILNFEYFNCCSVFERYTSDGLQGTEVTTVCTEVYTMCDNSFTCTLPCPFNLMTINAIIEISFDILLFFSIICRKEHEVGARDDDPLSDNVSLMLHDVYPDS
jgi:hypothetical protein